MFKRRVYVRTRECGGGLALCVGEMGKLEGKVGTCGVLGSSVAC